MLGSSRKPCGAYAPVVEPIQGSVYVYSHRAHREPATEVTGRTGLERGRVLSLKTPNLRNALSSYDEQAGNYKLVSCLRVIWPEGSLSDRLCLAFWNVWVLALVSMVSARSHKSTILWIALWVTSFGGTLQKLYVLHIPVSRHAFRCHCL